MARSDALPDHWYQYEFPLPKVANAPVPSKANYKPENVAWLIELFAQTLGQSHTDLKFRYENNTPDNPHDDIFVTHPHDKLYLAEKALCRPESSEMLHYESKARQSSILKLFQNNSPAGIEYFNDQGCSSFFAVTFALAPKSILSSNGFAGYLGDTLDELTVDKLSESFYSHNGDAAYIGNEGESENEYVVFDFNPLPEDAPEIYTSVTVRWFDRSIISTGTSGGATLTVGSNSKTDYYDLSTGYAYRQIIWAGRTFSKEELNTIRFRYHSGANPLSFPKKRLTVLEIIAQSG
jgi:hypothetical protein